MPFKTILVHVASDDACIERVKLAAGIAEKLGAHVVARYITSPVHMPAGISGRGASHAFLAEATEIAREKGAALEKEIIDRLGSLGVKSWEWKIEEGDHLETLTHYANLADLAIVAQSEPHTLEDKVVMQIPDHLGLHAPCPVLVFPLHETAPPGIGKRILVAWKDKREATRAVREALPFLKSAEEVILFAPVTSNEKFETGRDISTFLARHGVNCSARTSSDDRDAGPAILSLAEAENCDMVVMGAFGHSRWREMVLGGATRHILQHMAVPVFMTH